jgi:hypothetical protein
MDYKIMIYIIEKKIFWLKFDVLDYAKDIPTFM